MAKKKSTFSFADMQKTMGVISKKAGILIDTDKKERTYINTDIYMLNALLSKSIYGGVSDNRMTVFAGPEAVGKSYLCYNIARNAQKIGKNVIYIDTEFSIELTELEDFGIDVSPEKFMLIRSNKVEDIKLIPIKKLKMQLMVKIKLICQEQKLSNLYLELLMRT